MTIFDLEWNRGYDPKPLEEILQIGAVRLDKLGSPIISTFSAYIRPQLHKKLSSPAKRLPELQLSLDSELDFPTAYTAFREWCGDETEFAEWGRDDMKVLKANCEHWELPPIELEKVYDFQWAFSNLLEPGRQIRLCDAIEYIQIPSPFCFHNALHDALYTAMVGEWMGTERAMAEKPPKAKKHRPWKKRWKFSQCSFPPQRKPRVGPYQTLEIGLNARNARKPTCPICGGVCWVHTWYSLDARVFYGPFRCQTHGVFLARLTLNQQDNGTWRGRLAVPEITPELLETFEATAEGNSYGYQSTERMRKKRRWLARQAAIRRNT